MIAQTSSTHSGKPASGGWKTASGSPGWNPDKHAYRIDPQALQPRRENHPAASTSASGVSVYGFRWYEAGNGRWLGRDPAEEQGGVNLYRFVGNDAVNQSDVIGLIEFSIGAMTFIPTEYAEDPLGIIYKGDGSPGNFWIKRLSFRTRHVVSFDPQKILDQKGNRSAIRENDRVIGLSIRYRPLNLLERGFTNYENDTNVIFYKGTYYKKDAEERANISGMTYKIRYDEKRPCEFEIELTGRAGDPVGPPGVPKVDYKVTYVLKQVGNSWTASAEGSHDGFPSYGFYFGRSNYPRDIHRYSGEGHDPTEMFGTSDETFRIPEIFY